MIEHLLMDGYKSERFTVTTDSWGGTVEVWATQISDFAAHISYPKTTGLTHRVGQDDLAVDAVIYCAQGLDIAEGDRITDLDNKKWKVIYSPTHKIPVSADGFISLKVELVR